MNLRRGRYHLAFFSTLLIGSSGCYQALGLGDYKNGAGGEGASSGSGSSDTSTVTGTAASTSSGSGGCVPASTTACYSGPNGTADIGICKSGLKTCNADGTGYAMCVGDVLPAMETCTNTLDDDCDGNECAEWSHLYGSATDQTVSGVAVDSQGNLLIAGTFTGSLAFDPANPISANGTQIYLAKFDKTGLLLWDKVFASTGNVSVASLTVDQGDNAIISGGFDNTVTFGGAPINIGPTAYTASYVAKFTSAGAYGFSATLAFDDYTDQAVAAADSAGNIILFGNQTTDADFSDSFWMEKRSSAGTVIWHKRFAIVVHLTRSPGAIAVDPFNNILVAGAFAGSETFGGASFSSAGGSVDAFVAKFDSNGALLNKYVMGDTAIQGATGVASDSAGNIFVSGTYAGTIQLGTKTITSAGGNDIFVARIDGTNTGWLKSFGDASDQFGGPISVPALGAASVVFTGNTKGSVNYGGGVIPSGGGLDVPLVKLDANGNHVWSRVFGDADDQVGTGIALLGNGESVLTANVKGTINVGAGPLTSTGGVDVLLARFAP